MSSSSSNKQTVKMSVDSEMLKVQNLESKQQQMINKRSLGKSRASLKKYASSQCNKHP